MDDNQLQTLADGADRAANYEHASADTEAALMKDLQLRVADLERRMDRHDQFLHHHGEKPKEAGSDG